MVERGEDQSAVNLKKTFIAQRKRVEAAKKLGISCRKGFVESNYTNDGGGSVRTHIESGGASMYQNWIFAQDGQLTIVVVMRFLRGDRFSRGELVSNLELKKGNNGKFQVLKEMQGSSVAAWEKEFNTANKRIQANRDIPVRPMPQPLQK